MKTPLPQHVAEALASAFLAHGAWTRRALAARGVATIGDEAKWMGVVVESVLARRWRARAQDHHPGTS